MRFKPASNREMKDQTYGQNFGKSGCSKGVLPISVLLCPPTTTCGGTFTAILKHRAQDVLAKCRLRPWNQAFRCQVPVDPCLAGMTEHVPIRCFERRSKFWLIGQASSSSLISQSICLADVDLHVCICLPASHLTRNHCASVSSRSLRRRLSPTRDDCCLFSKPNIFHCALLIPATPQMEAH